MTLNVMLGQVCMSQYTHGSLLTLEHLTNCVKKGQKQELTYNTWKFLLYPFLYEFGIKSKLISDNLKCLQFLNISPDFYNFIFFWHLAEAKFKHCLYYHHPFRKQICVKCVGGWGDGKIMKTNIWLGICVNMTKWSGCMSHHSPEPDLWLNLKNWRRFWQHIARVCHLCSDMMRMFEISD